jgi:hypothetical protein
MAKKLIAEPVYLEATRIALEMIDQGKGDDLGFQAVVVRSTELGAIKQLISRGSKLENIVLSAPSLLLREDL